MIDLLSGAYAMSELAVAHDYLEACQFWQEILNAQESVAEKMQAGREAMSSLSDQTFYDTRKVIVGADAAMFLKDGVTGLDQEIWPNVQFGEMKTRGWLGRLTTFGLKNQVFIAWTLYEPVVLGPAKEIEVSQEETGSDINDSYRLPLNTQLRRPLHFPVGLINYAICYETA